MNSDRWQQISHLYHEALARHGDDRAAFLAETCRDDEPLRREVESLLAQPASAHAFLDSPALAQAAQMVSDVDASAALVGRRLGAYHVQARLGAGGMGEVYRARDTRLGRDVAIKILPRAFTSDPERLARFEREARTLAALNHPNIGSIYGLEDADGIRALVLELVEGETLADRIARRPLTLKDALPIAGQIADALEAAHDKGIVHRDLKPANVALTRDGTAKVLDFGLAKATSGTAAADGSHAPTMTIAGTSEGVVLGTASYMSPEQARGQAVDKRTDIWAFGCVLYEMLTGQVAFRGETLSDTIAVVLEREPNWMVLPAATPPTIRRLLLRCLEKDTKRRLRDIGDARVEIEDARTTAAGPTAEVTSSPRSARAPWLVAAAASIVALLSAASAWLIRPAAGEILSPLFHIVPVTTGPAREFGPDIEPDGKWVAYISDRDGQPNVLVKFLAGGESNLTALSGLDVSASTGISGLDISPDGPDGTRIAFMARTRGSTGAFGTWVISAPLAGAPRKLLKDSDLGMRWAPDGRQITFIHAGVAAGDALWVADDENGTNRREIIPARNGIHIHWPTWSRDGFIYFMRTITTIANLDQSEIYRIDSRGGEPSPVVTTPRRAMYPVLTPSGDGLIYAANPVGVELGLWWRAIGGGDPQRLSNGIGDYAEARISANGQKLVATRYELRQSLARVALTPAEFGRVTTVTDGYGGDLDPSISPSGNRVVFSSSRTGDRNLWTARLDGSDMRPLTSGNALDDRPAFSPDGKQIAFNSVRDGKRGIWKIEAEGGTPELLAEVSATGGLSWSTDGKRVVYAAAAGGWPGLWSVSVENRQVQQIATPGAVSEPVWNPVADLIAYLEPATSGPAYTRLAFVDSAGQPQYKTLSLPPAISAGFLNGMLAWSPDGGRLAVVSQNSNAAASIWIVDPESATPFQKVVELPVGPRIRGIAWARDGSALIIGQHDTTSDIVLLDQGR